MVTVCSGLRVQVKELLAQGVHFRRDNDKSKEDVSLEKRRQTPFHLHIVRRLWIWRCGMAARISPLGTAVVVEH